MKLINFIAVIILLSLSGISCKSQNNKETYILITTSFGDIKLKLYNETPIHRDNFIKLIQEGYFKDKIFHRVIRNFMIQGGMDPNATLTAAGNYNYTIPAELNQKFYHKRGALAAARKGDEVNPARASTANQFYIVQGEVFTIQKLNELETSINMQLVQSLARKYYLEEKKHNEANNTYFEPQPLYNRVIEKAQKEIKEKPYKFTEAQNKSYTTIGGAPHLDGFYTVFGEVTEGLNIVDSIAQIKTLKGDKPEKDVKFSIKIIQ